MSLAIIVTIQRDGLPLQQFGIDPFSGTYRWLASEPIEERAAGGRRLLGFMLSPSVDLSPLYTNGAPPPGQHGVWIEGGWMPGRWLGDAEVAGPWFGTFELAKELAAERNAVHRRNGLRYEVRP